MLTIDLNNKIALVTGGAAGIGKGCVNVLAAAGATVVIADKNEAAATALSQQLNEKGFNTMALAVDVANQLSVHQMRQAFEERYPHLDILVNNAGFNLFKGLEETTTDEWDALMNVDLKGPYLVIKELLPLLKKSGSASIVNISSNHTKSTIANIFAYATAKSGLAGMAASLCQELGAYNIRINTISPGFTETPLLQRWLSSTPNPEETMANVLQHHPLKRIGTPEDVGQAVAFLSSALAQNITGANLFVDGGLSLRLLH